MRSWLSALLVLVVFAVSASPAPAHERGHEFLSRSDLLQWMDDYRHRPEPSLLPRAVKAMSEMGLLREPDTAGYHLGFVAGVLGAAGPQAEQLASRLLPLPASDQWLVVRALAYSGLPDWKAILARMAPQLPARRDMTDAYLSGALPALEQIKIESAPGFMDKLKQDVGWGPKPPAMSYSRQPELLDTLWGQYFATGRREPIRLIVTMLPWSNDRDDIERLTAGSSAKYTLANNAARYPDILALIKAMQPGQSEAIKPILTDVTRAAETVDTTRIRKEQLALIEKIKTKGPGAQRDLKTWGLVGQGAIGITCVALAAVSFTVAGLPCVIGGAATSAALTYWSAQ